MCIAMGSIASMLITIQNPVQAEQLIKGDYDDSHGVDDDDDDDDDNHGVDGNDDDEEEEEEKWLMISDLWLVISY